VPFFVTSQVNDTAGSSKLASDIKNAMIADKDIKAHQNSEVHAERQSSSDHVQALAFRVR
jgi:hypothetical protein